MRTVYGESLSNPEVLNLRGQAYRVYDGAGVQTAVAYDFKGGPLAAERQLAVEYTQTPDWVDLAELEDVSDLEAAAASMLEAEVFRTESSFDALGRPVTQTTPDGSVVRLAYNEAALLEGVSANVRRAASETEFVSNIDYDAKGRRTLIAYGNGTHTSYARTSTEGGAEARLPQVQVVTSDLPSQQPLRDRLRLRLVPQPHAHGARREYDVTLTRVTGSARLRAHRGTPRGASSSRRAARPSPSAGCETSRPRAWLYDAFAVAHTLGAD